MSKTFEPTWFSKTVPINQTPSISIYEPKKNNLLGEPINIHNLRSEMKEDMTKFISLCGLRPYFKSKEYLTYIKNRNHPETIKYNSFWNNIQKIESQKRQEIDKENKLLEESYVENIEYDDRESEDEMFCDDFIEDNYNYRYTMNDNEHDEHENYVDSSSDEEEYIDCNFSDYE
jgi:hypothetical protein